MYNSTIVNLNKQIESKQALLRKHKRQLTNLEATAHYGKNHTAVLININSLRRKIEALNTEIKSIVDKRDRLSNTLKQKSTEVIVDDKF